MTVEELADAVCALSRSDRKRLAVLLRERAQAREKSEDAEEPTGEHGGGPGMGLGKHIGMGPASQEGDGLEIYVVRVP